MLKVYLKLSDAYKIEIEYIQQKIIEIKIMILYEQNLRREKFIKFALQSLHSISIIIYFNHIQYMADSVMLNKITDEKQINDYSRHSLKLIYQNTLVSIVFYIIITVSYLLQLVAMLILWIDRGTRKLIKYTFYYLLFLLLIYTIGQIVQLYKMDYGNELAKIRAYDKQENLTKASEEILEDGEFAQVFWKILLGFEMLLVVCFKILYIYIGLVYFKRLRGQPL
ncbi:hypothetical protein pb186bvf_006902 [Paramecium bursaria]